MFYITRFSLLIILILGFSNLSHALSVAGCEVEAVAAAVDQNDASFYMVTQTSAGTPLRCQVISGLEKTVDVLVLSFALVGTPATWEALGAATVSGTAIAAPLAVTAFVAGVGVATIKLTVMVTKDECLEADINSRVQAEVERYLKANLQSVQD